MTPFLLATIWFLVFSCSTYGWGTFAAAISGRPSTPWAVRMALGLAVYAFLGGVLNVLRLARPEVLSLILVLGVLLCIGAAIRHFRTQGVWPVDVGLARLGRTASDRLTTSVVIALLAVSYLYLVAYLVPTEIFNPHDDMQTYLTRPVRMLQTGTVGSSPFTPIGVDSLGAQAFLQAFVLAYLPVTYINLFDAIFCFLLAALVLLQLGRHVGAPPAAIALAVILFVAINPQYVNVSSLYSGSLMLVGLVFVALQADLQAPMSASQARRLLPHALFLAALLALKTTFVVFVAGFVAAYAVASLIMAPDRVEWAKRVIMLGLLTGAAVAPWALVFTQEYAEAFDLLLGGAGDGRPEVDAAGPIAPPWSMLSRSLYGGSLVQYHALAVLSALIAFWALAASPPADHRGRQLRAVLFALCSGASLSYAANLLVFNPNTAVRYSCPILIGALPAGLLLISTAVRADSPVRSRVRGMDHRITGPASIHRTEREEPSHEPPGGSRSSSPVSRAMPLLMLLLIASFATILMDRLDRIAHYRTLVSFPLHEQHVMVSRAAFRDGTQDAVGRAQDRMEPGTTIMALTATPFYLDYDRNPIVAVNDPGLLNPWLDLPVGAGAQELRAYLSDLGVQYVMWDYSREGMKSDQEFETYLRRPYEVYRRLGRYNLWLRRSLDRLMADSRIVYHDERRVVLGLGPVD